jgi:cellulose synthase/poly-beta-1,6-N-acetylglucosamine synthase-like glycosyltransferase
MTGAKIAITVVVPVKNEECNLPRCLAALSRFTEIIVVDSDSTDRTHELARATLFASVMTKHPDGTVLVLRASHSSTS